MQSCQRLHHLPNRLYSLRSSQITVSLYKLTQAQTAPTLGTSHSSNLMAGKLLRLVALAGY